MSGAFSFEGLGPDLRFLPLAARRALDASGFKLSLAGWSSLPIEARTELSLLGWAERVDGQAVERVIASAVPAALAIPASDETLLEPCDETASALLAPTRDLSRAWVTLSPLARFALRHLGKRGDAERIARAFDELTQVPARPTHLDEKGEAHMVDVGTKPLTKRRAIARARVTMSPATARAALTGSGPKGDVLACARIAGIMASKRTSELIPLCHPIALSRVAVELAVEADAGTITVTATAETSDRTGVEMEAMVAASVAALTLYDMLKGLERGIAIEHVVLLEKDGGRTGLYRREETR